MTIDSILQELVDEGSTIGVEEKKGFSVNDFHRKIYILAQGTSPQVALDLGILSGFLSQSAAGETREVAREALVRLAMNLATLVADAKYVDLDDASTICRP